jgi:hypothetical protein
MTAAFPHFFQTEVTSMRRLLRLGLLLALLATGLAVPTGANAQVDVVVEQSGMNLLAGSATTNRRNTDLAFWGNTLVQGDTRGIRVFDISNPAAPALLSDFECNGAYGDVTIWQNLVFRSIDVPQSTDACAGSTDQPKVVTGGNHTATAQSTTISPGFEGIRIIDISNPSSPTFVKGVATDCGSFSNTIVPDPANNRVLLYVSSFPNQAISSTATAYGNTCERLAAGSPAPPNHVSGHDKLTIVEVPLANPSGASVIAEVPLGLKGYNSYFSYLLHNANQALCSPLTNPSWSPNINGCYTGDFANTPGYKGCHDIAVLMPKKLAAAACVTEGLILDITNPAAPVVSQHVVNPYTDLCATGVYRWTTNQGTTATTPNCMWSTATFTHDGKHVIWGDLASGQSGCSSSSTGFNANSTTTLNVGHSCNRGGNTNVGVDRFYDGTSVTNECDIGGGSVVRSPTNRGAYWMFDLADPSFPISSFKTPRMERYDGQGCTSGLMNIVPVTGSYLMPASWHLGGVDVVDWTRKTADDPFYFDPVEVGWYDVNTSGPNDPLPTSSANATPTNRPAGNAAERSNAWAAYWYNGHVYASYDSPMYGDFVPAGSRGLEIFGLTTPQAAGAATLEHLNPQTQEFLITCTATSTGSLRARRTSTLRVNVRAMGMRPSGAPVTLRGAGVSASKLTTNGAASFRVRPKTAGRVTISVGDIPNMLGCKAPAKRVARAPRRASGVAGSGTGGGGAGLTGRALR